MVIVVVGASTGRIICGPGDRDRVPSGIITNVPITKFLHKSSRSLASPQFGDLGGPLTLMVAEEGWTETL